MAESVTRRRVRWTRREGDREARIEVVRAAWHGAYSHLLSADEIDRVFDGTAELEGSWSPRRTMPAGTLVAVEDEVVAGLISLAMLETLDLGEVVALYVRPEYQERGIGAALWNAGLGVLVSLGCSAVEVWTLAAAEARRFYESRGCALIGEGSVTVGSRTLAAVGYGRSLEGLAPAVVDFD